MIVPCKDEATWIAIRLSDEAGNPVPGAKYCLHMPDFSIMEGALGSEGKARVDGIVPGQASIEFPEFCNPDWKPR